LSKGVDGSRPSDKNGIFNREQGIRRPRNSFLVKKKQKSSFLW
jgi:hypothetical protein